MAGRSTTSTSRNIGSASGTLPPRRGDAILGPAMSVLAVPVRRLEDAKPRLGPILSAQERADLVLAMLLDILDATIAQPGWETWVISGDPRVLETAGRAGARAVVEEGSTLLRAVRQVEHDAIQHGAP